MGSCGELSLLNTVQWHSALVSLFFFLWPRRRTLQSGPCQVLAAPFVSRYIFQDGGIGSSTSFGAGGRSFIHCFAERVERLRMFIHRDRVKVFGLQCIASFETTENLETCTFLRWLWICCCVSFVYALLDSVSVIRILSRCWKKTPKYSSKWTLNGRNFL